MFNENDYVTIQASRPRLAAFFYGLCVTSLGLAAVGFLGICVHGGTTGTNGVVHFFAAVGTAVLFALGAMLAFEKSLDYSGTVRVDTRSDYCHVHYPHLAK